MTDLATLGIDDFLPLLRRDFTLSLGQRSISLRLTEVSPYKRQNGLKGGRIPFHLCFQGPLQPPLEQGTYPLSTEDGFAQSIFLVPVGREETGLVYQAVFN